MDPLKGSVLSKIYTVEGKAGNIDGIMEAIWKKKGIESDKYQSIKTEGENIEKSKKFYFNYILKCTRQGFELLLQAIQESQKDNNNCANYGRFLYLYYEFFLFDVFNLFSKLINHLNNVVFSHWRLKV